MPVTSYSHGSEFTQATLRLYSITRIAIENSHHLRITPLHPYLLLLEKFYEASYRATRESRQVKSYFSTRLILRTLALGQEVLGTGAECLRTKAVNSMTARGS